MNTLTVTKKKIIADKNGYTLPNYMGNNSVSFVADIPKSATVDHIKVDGIFLEDIKAKKHITYHKNLIEGERRVVATVEFPDEIPELYEKLAEYVVQDFEVYYHLEAVVDAD